MGSATASARLVESPLASPQRSDWRGLVREGDALSTLCGRGALLKADEFLSAG